MLDRRQECNGARGLTSFSAVRRINKRRRTVSGAPFLRGPPPRRRSFVLANRTRVPAGPFRKNARNVQSYNARSIGLSSSFPSLPRVFFSAPRVISSTLSLSLPTSSLRLFFIFAVVFASLVPPADFRGESKKSLVITVGY